MQGHVNSAAGMISIASAVNPSRRGSAKRRETQQTGGAKRRETQQTGGAKRRETQQTAWRQTHRIPADGVELSCGHGNSQTPMHTLALSAQSMTYEGAVVWKLPAPSAELESAARSITTAATATRTLNTIQRHRSVDTTIEDSGAAVGWLLASSTLSRAIAARMRWAHWH